MNQQIILTYIFLVDISVYFYYLTYIFDLIKLTTQNFTILFVNFITKMYNINDINDLSVNDFI